MLKLVIKLNGVKVRPSLKRTSLLKMLNPVIRLKSTKARALPKRTSLLEPVIRLNGVTMKP